jgi:hypothetical protein
MPLDASRLRQKIQRLEGALAGPIKAILATRGSLRRGSFVTLRRKCGKPNCRCVEGEGHPADYLSIREDGRTRLIYISADARPKVFEEAERYRQYRRQRALLAGRMRLLLSRIDELEEVLRTREPIAGRRKIGKSREKTD